LFVRYRSDATVSVGAAELPGVDTEKSWPQSEGLADVPPAELMQVEMMSASVLISVDGMVVPAAAPLPGEIPVTGSAYSFANANAEVSAETSEGEEPMAVMELIKGASALVAATVVTSLTEMKVDAVSDEQGPRAVIKARLGLLEPMPGFPPTAVRYTSVALLQE
jgi:hypothetical protein